MRRQIGICLAVILTANVGALLIGALMQTAPGFLPLAILAVVWWAKELETVDIDAEIRKLLQGAT